MTQIDRRSICCGFTVAEFTAKVRAMTGHTDYSVRQAAYDLRKLRGKELITKPGRSAATTCNRRPPAPSPPCSPCASTSSHRSSGVRSPRRGCKLATWTSVDRDYEKIRIDMQTVFQDLGIRAAG
jgi:hypothetical protein